MTMRLVLRAVLSAAAFVFLVSTAQAATEIGKVVAVAGSPTASGPGGDRKLSAGSAVFEDDKVTVGGAGNAQIILNDNTRLVVGPGSALVLDRFLMKTRVATVGIRGSGNVLFAGTADDCDPSKVGAGKLSQRIERTRKISDGLYRWVNKAKRNGAKQFQYVR